MQKQDNFELLMKFKLFIFGDLEYKCSCDAHCSLQEEQCCLLPDELSRRKSIDPITSINQVPIPALVSVGPPLASHAL